MKHTFGIACSMRTFLKKKSKKRESLIDGFVNMPSIIFIYATKGRGKTNLRDAMAHSIATGKSFMNTWDVPIKRVVLIVDGEMSDADTLDRHSTKTWKGSKDALDNVFYISSDYTFEKLGHNLDITSPEDQKVIDDTIEEMTQAGKRPDVVFFDNLSSLAPRVDENSNTAQWDYLEYLVKLRHQKIASAFFHHSGKNDGDQRGASRREDFCDLVIALRPAKQPSAARGVCAFTLAFVRARSSMPEPASLRCELDRKTGTWLTSIPNLKGTKAKQEVWKTRLQWISEKKPTSLRAMAKELDISVSTLSESLKPARTLKYLKPNSVEFTAQGLEFLGEMK